MTDGRARLRRALTSLSAAVLLSAGLTTGLTAAPSAAEPTIDDARQRVQRLHREAEQASERYNDARIRLEDARARLRRLESELETRRAQVAEMRDQLAAQVVDYYQGDALSTTGSLVTADDPDAVIAEMTTISQYTSAHSDLIERLDAEVETLEQREASAEEAARTITEAKATLAEERENIRQKAGVAERLLDRLEEEAAERASRSETRAPVTEVTASGGAGAAVQYALAQVGDAYSYGAAGPDAFDCSGLTMMAWAQGGVSLPHSSSAQMSSGTPVSTSALAPGDLVFYYSPVSHVGIYVGDGMIAHAANPSTDVRVDPVDSMPISGAVRPG